ncbi:uncharacterized protein MICPUCDRAFT_52416 [Micromonas pusilla CCMP1545]|uniref:NAD(+) diphosphatase n=1 Tax=Micromonas pusilla (strain CCMP1545) TaxID=564608 RepID=C1N454_MICPC|nr:uncharacterized protein MICPUCDRAFT_52416 [Micromonas pusilla CCMP1545]EEH53306.1 predicted protein [Micromonas pusilla CCMP1545]|eukprot:XP_003062487.1 predicted protein [Micromonas pusilla CCMP1545]
MSTAAAAAPRSAAAAAAAPRSAAAALRARGRGGGASASRASPAPAPGRRRSVVVVDRGADDERLVTRRPRRRRLLPLLRATFDDGDGVPFFALSDASRASELRADADAIAALQTRRDAVLLPTTSGKSWVLEVRRARSGAGAGSDADAEDASFAESASFVAAEARLASLPDELLAGRDLSFMGFRGADGAPLFTTDVPSSADDDPMAYATRKAVADNYASMRRQRLQTGASAGEASLADVLSRIRVADAKAVGPMMSRDDAGVLAAAQALTSWQRNNKFCSRCGSPNKLVKSGHKAQCTRINDDKCRGAAYPTLMPAVLTLCTCGEYALLARNSKWPRGFYSCLAGFVDQSESLEQAAAREVIEESGIGIVPGSATYVASQPWPFPCQLMVGFRAEVAAIAVGGEERSDGAGAGEASLPASRSGAFYTLVPIRPRWRERPSFPARFLSPPNPTLDRNELRDARWFHKDWLRAQLGKNVDPRETPGAGEIPEGEIALPGRHAMARALIERWVEEDEVRSIHWSPYDRVRVVNADP